MIEIDIWKQTNRDKTHSITSTNGSWFWIRYSDTNRKRWMNRRHHLIWLIYRPFTSELFYFNCEVLQVLLCNDSAVIIEINFWTYRLCLIDWYSLFQHFLFIFCFRISDLEPLGLWIRKSKRTRWPQAENRMCVYG